MVRIVGRAIDDGLRCPDGAFFLQTQQLGRRLEFDGAVYACLLDGLPAGDRDELVLEDGMPITRHAGSSENGGIRGCLMPCLSAMLDADVSRGFGSV